MRVSAVGPQGEQDVEHGTSPTRRPSLSTTATASRSTSWLASLGEPVGDLLDLVPRLGRDERGGHDPAGLVLGVAEQLAAGRAPSSAGCARGPRRATSSGRSRSASTASSGSMAATQAGRLDGVRLAQQLLEVVGLHLLEGVGRLVGAEGGQQLAALVAAQVLEQVGQLAGAQPVQALVGRLAAARGWPPCTSPADSAKGWMAAQSMTRSGVGRGRHRRGPRRRNSVALETSAPTSRMRPMTSAR